MSRRVKPVGQRSSGHSELLEARRLLSAASNLVAHPLISALPAPTASATGYSPTQINAAYGINDISFDGVTGTGAGQTIAIVVADDDPDLVDSTSASFDTSDLHKFDVAMGLPDPPSFTKVDEFGHSDSLPTTTSAEWADEAALDVEWTHAVAPDANIELVECYSADLSDLVQGSMQYISIQSSVSVVNLSFSIAEFADETTDDSYIHPSGGEPQTVVAASGDSGGAGTQYPASSPDVVSVGSTKLTLSNGSYSSETVSNTSSGGLSAYETKPAYQAGVASYAVNRTTPDVSIDGDASTGLSVYDSFDGGASTPWYDVGGTSASTPLWSGLIAIADQGRANLGLKPLDGPTQTLPRLYSLNSSDFHDITTGSNGAFFGVTGYDLASGIGTPIANKLVPDLAAGSSISGTVFNDANGNGTLDSGETGLHGYTVYLDIYGSGTDEGSDPSVVSGTDGTYDLADLPGGTYTLTQVTPSGVNLTTAATRTVTLGYNTSATGQNIGFKANGGANQLAFAQQPTAVATGELISPAITVDVEDANGNLVTTDNSAVTLSLAGGTATPGGTLTENAVNGVATFSNISIATAANGYELEASDGTLIGTTSAAFNVSVPAAGAAAQLVFLQPPTTITVGSVVSPSISVEVVDSAGDVVTTDDSVVALALANGPSGATVGGTLSASAVNGVATFSNITLSAVGTYTLSASDGVLAPVTSASFGVNAAATAPTSSQLIFYQDPTATAVGVAISPAITVDVEDASGNIVTTDGSAVTLAIANGPSGAILGGTLTVDAVNGVATFPGITASVAGSYSLSATDGILSAATSTGFFVSAVQSLRTTITADTLASSVVAGSAVHDRIVLSETNLAAKTTGTVTTDVYAYDTTDGAVELGSYSRKFTWVTGKTYTVSVPITKIPAGLSGNYEVYAIVQDAASSTSITVSSQRLDVAAAFTSLAPSLIRDTLAASVVSGSKSKAAATIKVTNGGNVNSTGSTTVDVLASPDGLLADAVLIAGVTKKITVKPDGSATVSVPLKAIPASVDGSYSILVAVNSPAGALSSISSGTVQVAPAFVSIAASAVSIAPATITPGKTATLTVTLENSGNVPSSGQATITIDLSADGVTQTANLASILKTIALPIGKPVVLRLKFAVPADATAGTYFPLVSYVQNGVSAQKAGAASITVG